MELTKEEFSKKILQDSEKLVKDSALNIQETLSSFVENDLTEKDILTAIYLTLNVQNNTIQSLLYNLSLLVALSNKEK
jgi:hypothetical protein|nr:MAG TPA: hypothetical protein [Caudoviricetes sp.]